MKKNDETVVDFVENGIHYHAEKGYALAYKNGHEIWRAGDVFMTKPPTKELVKELDNFFTSQFFKVLEDDENEI